MPVLGSEWKNPDTGAARKSAGMTRIVVDVSPEHITIGAFRYRFTTEERTLGTRHAHGARRHARHTFYRTGHELAQLPGRRENGEDALGRKQLTKDSRVGVDSGMAHVSVPRCCAHWIDFRNSSGLT